MGQWSHISDSGRPRMVDVSAKEPTRRIAWAAGHVRVSPSTLETLQKEGSPKGPILDTARLAGIMAAKQTGYLIPLCHPLPLDQIDIAFQWTPEGLYLESRVIATARTGVEMEALTAVTVAALTVYDMCKSVDKSIQVGPFYLLRKEGGKSGIIEFGLPRLFRQRSDPESD